MDVSIEMYCAQRKFLWLTRKRRSHLQDKERGRLMQCDIHGDHGPFEE